MTAAAASGRLWYHAIMPPLPALLGLNLWFTTLLVPLALARGQAPLWVWGTVPLFPLALFLSGRRPSGDAYAGDAPVVLDLLAPLRLLAPLLTLVPGAELAQRPEARTPPALLPLCALSLLAFLAAQSQALSRGGPPPLAATPLPPQLGQATPGSPINNDLPQRWLRRALVYRGLAVYAAVLPGVLLYGLLLHPPTLHALRQGFSDDAQRASFQAAGCGAVALLLVFVFQLALLGPLRVHLEHDRAVTAEQLALRQLARRGRPRPQFYLALLLSLASMILLAYRSLHP